MNHNKTTQRIGFIDSIHESTAEQSLDADIILPDYCPEISKILKCTVIPNISSTTNNAGRITTDASASVRILYLGENGNFASYEQNYPIQKHIESDKISSDSAVTVNLKTDYANCRAVNSRRIDVRAMMTFTFKINNKRTESILTAIDGAGIQTISDELSVASLCGMNERAFTLSEVIEIPENKSSVSRIINVDSSAILSELKIINNKALIKGDCNLKIYYISDETAAVEFVEHIIPISQILELDGLTDNCKTNVTLKICLCETTPKSDSSGNMRLIDFNARINAFITAFDEIPVSLITDAYSTNCEIKNTYKNIELLKFNDKFDTIFTNKVVLESIGVSVNCVTAVWCSDIKYTFASKDDKCLISGTYQANIIYKDNDNKTGIIQKPVDFDYSVKMNEKSDRIVCYGTVQLLSCSCAAVGDSRLEMKTELSSSGIILSNLSYKYISNFEFINENKTKDNCALTIYFSDKGETLWNIAKKYSTTVEAIQNENNYPNEIIEEKCMLLIPADN